MHRQGKPEFLVPLKVIRVVPLSALQWYHLHRYDGTASALSAEKSLWPKYKDNKDFKLLVIGREHTDADLTKYNERKKFSFPLYPDPKREVYSLFAEKTIPRVYLFGKDGKLLHLSIGYTKEEFQHLMETIENAL